MATTVRTPEDEERARIEGKRSQQELLDALLSTGSITLEQANEWAEEYGLTVWAELGK